MHRSAPLCLAACMFAACSTAPMPSPLVARGLFDAHYEGSVRPLDAADENVFAYQPPRAAAQPMATIAFRATVLELSIEEARYLVPDLLAPPPAPVEVVGDELAGASTRQSSDTHVETHGERVVAAAPRVRGIGLTGGHVEPQALREALVVFTGPDVPQRVVAESQGVVAIGGETAVTTSSQLAFVRGMRLAAVADSFLVQDIEVDEFEYGRQLRLAAHPDGESVRLEVRWIERAPVRPIAVSGSRLGHLQVPVLTRHDVTASTIVAPEDSIVVASLPGSDAEHVQILCLEVAAQQADPVAVR